MDVRTMDSGLNRSAGRGTVPPKGSLQLPAGHLPNPYATEKRAAMNQVEKRFDNGPTHFSHTGEVLPQLQGLDLSLQPATRYHLNAWSARFLHPRNPNLKGVSIIPLIKHRYVTFLVLIWLDFIYSQCDFEILLAKATISLDYFFITYNSKGIFEKFILFFW